MCKHSSRVPLGERTDSNMKSADQEQGAKPQAQSQGGSSHHSSQGRGRRVAANFRSSTAKPQQQQQFPPQTGARKQSQRFNKMDLQNNNGGNANAVVESAPKRHPGANENTRHLKRHSTVQRASPSKHLHMLNNNNTTMGSSSATSSYGDRATKNTSPIPSTMSRSSPVSIPGATAKVHGQPAYAGAKFSDPPSPKVLPKPPTHWVAPPAGQDQSSCAEMTSVLKVMLKVQA